MSEREKLASELFKSGKNCSQSVLGVFCKDYGLEPATALKVAGGFGSGIRSGEVCGAVTGAVMAIGLAHGDTTSECNSKTKEFIRKFKEANQSIVCREILRCDLSKLKGEERKDATKKTNRRCTELVCNAVRILEEMGY